MASDRSFVTARAALTDRRLPPPEVRDELRHGRPVCAALLGPRVQSALQDGHEPDDTRRAPPFSAFALTPVTAFAIIAMKRAAGRMKDRIAIEHLGALRDELDRRDS
jgi:hypothetical protein